MHAGSSIRIDLEAVHGSLLAEEVSQYVVGVAVRALRGGETLGAAGGAGETCEVGGKEVPLRALAALEGGVDEAVAIGPYGGCQEEEEEPGCESHPQGYKLIRINNDGY